MANITHTQRVQSLPEPSKLQAAGLDGVHEDWRHAVQSYPLCEELYINCINGRTGGEWSFCTEGPPAFSVNILLEGNMQAAFDDGAVINAHSGSTILMASGQYTSGWDILDSQSNGIFRLISIHLPQEAMIKLTGLTMDNLRQRARVFSGEQAHLDAFLGILPASSTLQRVASDLLGLGSIYSCPSVARDLYVRAKAMEAIAYFLHENLEQAERTLPVPADRQRLIDAHALLERHYDQDLSVQYLARAAGLNEKRLQSGFQALYGCSVHTCLTRIRLNAAVSLLQRGNSVTETAACCGFSSLSHFSRVFRNYIGISPKQCAMGIHPVASQKALP